MNRKNSIRVIGIINNARKRMAAAISAERTSVEIHKLVKGIDYHVPFFIVSIFPYFLSKDLKEVRAHFIKKGCVISIRKIYGIPAMIAIWK